MAEQGDLLISSEVGHLTSQFVNSPTLTSTGGGVRLYNDRRLAPVSYEFGDPHF